MRNTQDNSKYSFFDSFERRDHLTFFNADLLREHSFDEAFQGVDCVFHTASPITSSSDNPDDFMLPAVNGTRNVLSSCVKNNVKFVVLTSSTAAVAPDVEPEVKSESDWSSVESKLANKRY